MTDWVRLWHDMPTDPKWRGIAKKSGQAIGNVIAVFNFMMVNASANANERGRTHNLFADDIASALDLETADVEAILGAMIGKIWDADGWLTGWQKRQPKREDSSAERSKAWRQERKRTQTNANERPETETETEYSVDKSTDANVDSDAKFWSNAKAYLGPSKASMVGKWCRDYGKDGTARAITEAQLNRAADPVSYINRVLKGGRPNGHDELPIC